MNHWIMKMREYVYMSLRLSRNPTIIIAPTVAEYLKGQKRLTVWEYL